MKQTESVFLGNYFLGKGKQSSPKISKLLFQDWIASYLLLAKTQTENVELKFGKVNTFSLCVVSSCVQK